MVGSRLWTDREARPLAAILLVSLISIFLDNWLAPALRNSSPFWTIGFLLVLILRRSREHQWPATAWASFWPRLALFMLLHAGIIGLARIGGPGLVGASVKTSLVAAAIALLKYLVLVPTLVLLAPEDWLRVWRAYKAEIIVAATVLFTWDPHRIFVTTWPWYSAGLGRFVHAFASLFVPGLGYAPGLVPTFLGTHLNVSIIFACSGLEGVIFFQRLFGLMLVVDWNRLNKQRLLVSYFAGLIIMIAANALRITLLVVLGNRVSARLVERYHISAGWGFFAAVFIVYLACSYHWLLRESAAAAVSPNWGQPQIRNAS